MNTEIHFDNLPSGGTFLVYDNLDLNGPSIHVNKNVANVMEFGILDDCLKYSNNDYELIAELEFEGIVSEIAFVRSLWVTKDYSEIGLATKFIQRLIEWARIRKIKEIRLTSAAVSSRISQEALDNFYLKNGFKNDNGQMVFKV